MTCPESTLLPWLRNCAVILGLIGVMIHPARAELPNTYQCVGQPTTIYSIMYSPPDMMLAGDKAYSDEIRGDTGIIECPCGGTDRTYTLYVTSQTSLPHPGSLYGAWLELNDTMEVQVLTYRNYGSSGYWEAVPQRPAPTDDRLTCTSDTSSVTQSSESGRTGKVTLRLRKDLTFGTSNFSGELARLYQARSNTENLNPGYPTVIVNGNISVHADATCSLRAGDTITVDLGSINKSALTEGGVPSEGYVAPTIDLSIDCTNLNSETTAINYMIQSASGSEGDIITTDLSGVGILLRDSDGNAVGLGESGSFNVPLNMNSASYTLKPYPTKLAGQNVSAGNYTGRAVITLTLP